MAGWRSVRALISCGMAEILPKYLARPSGLPFPLSNTYVLPLFFSHLIVCSVILFYTWFDLRYVR